MLLRDLDEEKSKSYGFKLRILDLQSFSAFKGRVTKWVIIRIAVD
jgi:hypothetical protein